MTVLWILFPTDVLKVNQAVFLSYEMFSPSCSQTRSKWLCGNKDRNDMGYQNGRIPLLLLM